MSLLSLTYFDTPRRSIPQGAYNDLQAYVDRFEADALNQLLGYALAKLVLAYENPGSDQRIIDIVEGKEYTVNGYTVKWNGLVNSDKVSLLADYVYVQYVIGKMVTLQNVGPAVSSVENGVIVGVMPLIMPVWHEMRELSGYIGQDYLSASLYNYFYNHESDYPELIFREFEPLNHLGI